MYSFRRARQLACFALLLLWTDSAGAQPSGVRVEPLSARLELINASRTELHAYWITEDGSERLTLKVKPNARKNIRTTVGHVHVIRDPNGNELDRVASTHPIQGHYFHHAGQVRLESLIERLPHNKVLKIPANVNVPAFYSKLILAGGYPVVGSSSVDDFAFREAAHLINQLLSGRPEVRAAMIASGSRMCIMSEDEYTTDLPEFRWLAARSPVDGVTGRDYWDARARGLGGSETDPFCSVGEENLLAFRGDPYSTENILIHEFAHNIHLRGMLNVDRTFDRRLRRVYDTAMAKGLWKGKYASVNHHEYFAEGVQSWFDDNRENDHDHNHVNTRAELVDYDPDLADMCREVFGNTQLKYTKPTTRLTGHLAGYDPSGAPTFKWPARLTTAKREIHRLAQERSASD